MRLLRAPVHRLATKHREAKIEHMQVEWRARFGGQPRRIGARRTVDDGVPLSAQHLGEHGAQHRVILSEQNPQRPNRRSGLPTGRLRAWKRRQFERETRAMADIALHRHLAVGACDRARDDREPEPRANALGLGREERLEDAREVGRRDAVTRILDSDPRMERTIGAVRSNRGHPKRAAGGHRVARIEQEIEQEMTRNLELCQKSLNEYLDMKKKIFPRFYFVSNVALLDMLPGFEVVKLYESDILLRNAALTSP